MSFKIVFHSDSNYRVVEFKMDTTSDSEDEEQILEPPRHRHDEIRRRIRQMRYRTYVHAFKNFWDKESIFMECFGIGPEEFLELHDMLEGKLCRYRRQIPGNLSTKDCLAVTLRFLASGLTMQDLGRQYTIAYSKILRVIRIVSKVMGKHLMPLVMPEPTREMWEKNAEDFSIKYNMPNCIGAIEGKNLFVDGKKIVFMTIVDANDRFVMIDLGQYRKNLYRGNVLKNSVIEKKFIENEFDVPEDKPLSENSRPVPFMILGSSLFPSKSYLMTKHSRPECAKNDLNRVFNTRISRAKLTVNRALLRLRHKWKVFQGPLPVPLKLLDNIVLCCCCLQNLFDQRIRGPNTPEPPDSFAMLTDERLDSLKSLLPTESKDIRVEFKKYFLSPEGQVPWQWQEIL